VQRDESGQYKGQTWCDSPKTKPIEIQWTDILQAPRTAERGTRDQKPGNDKEHCHTKISIPRDKGYDMTQTKRTGQVRCPEMIVHVKMKQHYEENGDPAQRINQRASFVGWSI
jgi:hypothetical protein